MAYFKVFLCICFCQCSIIVNIYSQANPAITSWLQNTTNIMGRHYVKGNSTPIQDNVLANVQSVKYSADWVYVMSSGIPAYITGPFLDGNPSIAQNQNAIFKISLKPVKNTGMLTNTTPGNIGIFINGVALFDFRDDVSWQNSTGSLKGGPLGGMGDKVWNRDAVVAERGGFDCAKAHPAMGNYHHHQNPSAFKLDLSVLSNVCNLYDSDGLYVIDSSKHSPLIGFAYDGFPIYGAYAYKNADGTGGIVRMKSSYNLRSIIQRNTYANGNSVISGPEVSSIYPLGYFREDYEYIAHPNNSDYLDEHNGRFCITPEYPNGIYCYFATVDEKWNSAYPYVVGPTFYGVRNASKVNAINENVNTYVAPSIVIISSVDSICEGTNVEFTANIKNGSNKPKFQWYKNNMAVGTNSTKYQDSNLKNFDLITCTLTTDIQAQAISNIIEVHVVTNTKPEIQIQTQSTTICEGEEVEFAASAINAGSNPMYQWYKNNNKVGSNFNSYKEKNMVDADVVFCVLQNKEKCVNPMEVNSNQIRMQVNPYVKAEIMINTANTTIHSGDIVQFNGISINGGTNPSYRWFKNGIEVGTNSITYLDNSLKDGDEIECQLESNEQCIIEKIVRSNKLIMKVITETMDKTTSSNYSIYYIANEEKIVIQANDMNRVDVEIKLYDLFGKEINSTTLFQGSALAYFDTKTMYNGKYFIQIAGQRMVGINLIRN